MKKFLLWLILTIILPSISLANQIDENFLKNYTYKLSTIDKPIKLENGQYRDEDVKVTLVKYAMKGEDIREKERQMQVYLYLQDKLPDAVVVFLVEKNKKQDYWITSLIEVGKDTIVQSNSVILSAFKEKITGVQDIILDYAILNAVPLIEIITNTVNQEVTVSLSIQKVTNQYKLIDYRSTFVKKPALYLYPAKDIAIEVNLNPLGKITKTIPEYKNLWKVNVTKEGLIDGKYNYLFYEVKLFFPVNPPAEGWVVPYSELQNWFKEYLPKLGLNERETKDFMNYWLKALEPAKYYIVKLFDRAWIDKNLALEINPEPKKFLRLIFYFEPTDAKLALKEPKIELFTREGFTAVEWGGIVKESKKADIEAETLSVIDTYLLKEFSNEQQKTGIEILKELAIGEKKISIRVRTGGCTGKDNIKPYIMTFLDQEKNIPVCEITFVRTSPDFCKAFFPEGINIVYDIEKDLKIKGPCIIKVNNPIFTENLIKWFTIFGKEEMPVAVDTDKALEEYALKLNLISSTIKAMEMEIQRYEQSSHSDKEEKIAYLKNELKKFKNMKPEEYVSERKEQEKDPFDTSFGPLMPPIKKEVEVIVKDRLSIGSMLEIVGMTKSGPFYHVAGVSGELEKLPKGRYKLEIFLVYKREYFGFIPNYYVYINKVTSVPISAKQASHLTAETLKNFMYYLKFSNEYITLKNGEYKRTKDLGNFLIVKLDRYLICDLNKDSSPDAVVILAQSGGGSGSFYEITAVMAAGNWIYQTDSYVLGDRIEIKNIEVTTEKDGTKVYVDFKEWAPAKKNNPDKRECFLIAKEASENKYKLLQCK